MWSLSFFYTLKDANLFIKCAEVCLFNNVSSTPRQGHVTTDMKNLDPSDSRQLCFLRPSCIRIIPLPIGGHSRMDNMGWEIKKEIERERRGSEMIARNKNRRHRGVEVTLTDGLSILLRCLYIPEPVAWCVIRVSWHGVTVAFSLFVVGNSQNPPGLITALVVWHLSPPACPTALRDMIKRP